VTLRPSDRLMPEVTPMTHTPDHASLLPGRRTLLTGAALLAAAPATALAGCGAGSGKRADSDRSAALKNAPATSNTASVRIGYFPVLTHAPALVADREGFFTDHVGAGKVHIQQFNAGPDAVDALFGGSLDLVYLGPDPTVTAYAQSQGAAVRVVSGATSGGSSFVVRNDLRGASSLKGRTLATPQLGSAQDVALRWWLKEHGLATSPEGGGAVTIVPQKNEAALRSFVLDQIAGAWIPEPYATQFVQKGAVVLVDERDLWPEHSFCTTDLVVRKTFLDEHPGTVRAVLEAHLDALDLLIGDAPAAQRSVLAQLSATTGQAVAAGSIAMAWDKLSFTVDPLAQTLTTAAEHADVVGLLKVKPADGFAKLWDLDLVNAALAARGDRPVST
jgi:NitT/TauT family transport system substrate-binding protein